MRLLGDPLRLGQILINCVTNAVKFTAQGEMCVRVRLASTEAQHCLVVFEVVDTGISLDLSICKGLAQLMGGSVGVDSQPGHGSTFWFTVRLGLPHLAEDRPDPSGDPALLLGPVWGARILVVEDNLINQQVASEMLASQGLAVVLAGDGQAALDAIAGSHQQEQAFDLVLMDLQMPGMDGLTALAHLRADGRNATLPVVALRANVLQEEREACANAGMNGCVGKPIDARVFWQAMRQLIQPRVGLGLAQPSQYPADCPHPQKRGGQNWCHAPDVCGIRIGRVFANTR